MRAICLALTLWLLCCGCSEKRPEVASTIAAIDAASFAVLETELTPAILVHSRSKYLGLFADAPPLSHIAFSTRNGPRSFRRAEKLKADELEECWLLVWGQNVPPWVVYLQRKPLALSLDTNGLHMSFVNGAGDVVLLPLHGTSTNINTKKWPEFLTREPLLRIRYWAGALREFPFECQTTFMAEPSKGGTTNSNTIHQQFRFHSIRDDWNTKPLRIAPVPPPLAAIADQELKRKLRDLKMTTPFGAYVAFEEVSEWTAAFPNLKPNPNPTLTTNCAWVSLGDCKVPAPNTALIHPIQTNGWPRITNIGAIKTSRDEHAPPTTQKLLNASTQLISF